MSDRIIQVSGVARPNARMAKMLSILGAPRDVRLADAMSAEVAVDALARALTEAMEKCQTIDGRVDMRDVAAHVLSQMKQNQK